MLDNVIWAVFTVLAVVGFVCAVYWLMLRLIRPKKDERYYEVLVFGRAERNACLRVSYLLAQLMSTGNIRSCCILAVDAGLQPWYRQNLQEAFGRDPHVTICTPEEANAILFEKKPEKDGQSTFLGS